MTSFAPCSFRCVENIRACFFRYHVDGIPFIQSIMQDTIFVVNAEPYCLWDIDLKARNRDFLKGLDPDYFDYSFNRHLEADDEKRASIGIRLALHHSLETLFSLLCAYIQAPDCAYAWLAKCSTSELRDLVTRISNREPDIFTKVRIESVTWESIATSVFCCYLPNTERQVETIKSFSKLWEILARELCDPTHIDEYNAMKHGFRVRQGGFGISIGREPALGVPPPDSEMQLLGKSDYGSAFFTIEPVFESKKSRSLRVRQRYVNWSIERLILLNQLVHMSIGNVISALRIVNGALAMECKFVRPEAGADFDKPWTFTPGVMNMTLNTGVGQTNTKSFTKDELLALINDPRNS
jgi:hypothetical protein